MPVLPVTTPGYDPTATSNVAATGAATAIGRVSVLPTNEISQVNLLGQFGQGSAWNFHNAEVNTTGQGATEAPGVSNNTILVQAGLSYTEQFNIARGDKLDLSHVLAGAPISQDLTGLSQFVKVVGHGPNDPGYGHGTKTTLEVTGLGGSARIDLQGSGRVDLKDLLHHDSLILPH
jgi:hypothetical protein